MFKLHCDRCGKFIKEVGGPEAKELSLAGSTVCKSCTATEENLAKFADKLKRSWEGKINTLINSAHKELKAGLNKIQSE